MKANGRRLRTISLGLKIDLQNLLFYKNNEYWYWLA